MFQSVNCGVIRARWELAREEFSGKQNRGKKMALQRRLLAAALCIAFAAMAFMNPLRAAVPSHSGSQTSAPAKAHGDPWTAEQTVQPGALAKELSDSNPAERPIVICAGFHVLYKAAHIPGASYHGPARTQEGLADLKKWAGSLPRASNIVLYCGCCPLEHCPNLRPAFTALREMGFSHLRVLLLPTDFHTDWTQHGYPTEKGAN